MYAYESYVVHDSPSEVQFPIETSPRHIGSGNILERFVRYHIDYRANNGFSIRKKKT